MNIKGTNTIINLDGANVKECLNIDGKLCIAKYPIQDSCYDTWAEVMCYSLSSVLGISCCEAGILTDNRSYSVVDRQLRTHLVDANKFLAISDSSLDKVYYAMKIIKLSDFVIIDWIKKAWFDVLTRQLDRNLTNFMFVYKNRDKSTATLYPLFDNGLSLFSTTRFKQEHEFRSASGSSLSELIEILVQLTKRYELSFLDIFLVKLTNEKLNYIWRAIPDKFINGNFKKDIINWVIGQQLIIENAINKKGGMSSF